MIVLFRLIIFFMRITYPGWILINLERYGDVFYWPMLYIFGPVFRSAQNKGIRIMLDGIGGDDLFAVGLSHLTDYLLQGNFR